MRLISINVLKDGMVVGRTIWNEAGHPLLQKGVVVSDQMINRLRQLKIRYMYIDDKISSGIEIEETVSPIIRNETVSKISDSFQLLKGVSVSDASYVFDQQSKTIGKIVDQLLNIILTSEDILTVLTDAYLYDEYLYHHSFQVTMYAIAIARELGYSQKDLRLIGIGAMLHDIGKLQIPQSILAKPGRLTNEEFEEMKLHTRYGFDLLRNLHSVSLIVAHCAFQHHERLDGSGYPRGLVEHEIHSFAKIIGVADVFDAVTSNRVYRDKMLPSQGIAILDAGCGTIFDTTIVNALKRSVVHYPNGFIVKLSDGRRGVIAKQSSLHPMFPFVRIFEENNTIINATYEIDLFDHPTVKIEKIETDYIAYVE